MAHRSLKVVYVIWFFCGLFGGHRFYLRHNALGLLYLFTLGVLGIGWLVDLFLLPRLTADFNALYIDDYYGIESPLVT